MLSLQKCSPGISFWECPHLALNYFPPWKLTRKVSEVVNALNIHHVTHNFSVSNIFSWFNYCLCCGWGGCLRGLSSFTSTVCSAQAADRRTMFVFTHLLQELRLDCTVKNGSGLLLGLFFPPQHNFPLVNWSVFASLSTPAKQHFPWS